MIQTVYAVYAIGYALVRASTLVRSQEAVKEAGFSDSTSNDSFVTGPVGTNIFFGGGAPACFGCFLNAVKL